MPNSSKAKPRLVATKIEAAVSWRDRPHLNLKVASEIAGVSPASLYRYAAEGQLQFRKFGGRTMVETASFAALLDAAEPWSPSDRCASANAARAPRAAQARSYGEV